MSDKVNTMVIAPSGMFDGLVAAAVNKTDNGIIVLNQDGGSICWIECEDRFKSEVYSLLTDAVFNAHTGSTVGKIDWTFLG